MWAVFDLEFTNTTKYSNLKYLYEDLNKQTDYLSENKNSRLPSCICDKKGNIKVTQNEFCRMEIQTLSNGDNIIICSEIWGSPDYDKPKKFAIKAEKDILNKILAEFTKRQNKLENYSELLEQYSSRSNCKVVSLKEIQKDKQKEPKKSNKQIQSEQVEENNIEKFNERNLDI